MPLSRQIPSLKEENLMERAYKEIKDIAGSKKRFAAGAKDVVVRAARASSGVGGRFPDQERSEQKARENERLSLLPAVFGHEVANSLTVISSSLQFVEMELATKGVNDPTLMAIIRGAVEEINRLDSLVNE